jgi:excisionase family DNA binding protein
MSSTLEVPADWRTRSTLTVSEAGAVVGIARDSAYAAVASGDLPSIRIGKRIVCPVAPLRRLLGEIVEAPLAELAQ